MRPMSAKAELRDTMWRECLSCRELKPLHEDVFAKRPGGFYSRCAKCNSVATTNREKQKKAESAPEKYLSCECGYLWNKIGGKQFCAMCGGRGES